MPDWSYWGHLKTLSLRSAIQLSMGLDPERHHPATEIDITLRETYYKRSRIVANHAPGAIWVVGRVTREDGDVSLEFTDCYLKPFVQWFLDELTFPVAEEFRSLSEFHRTPSPVEEALTASTPVPTPPVPVHKMVNRNRDSAFYYAKQPIGVLEDLLRSHGGNIAAAARSIDVPRQTLQRVITNLRAGRSPWAAR